MMIREAHVATTLLFLLCCCSFAVRQSLATNPPVVNFTVVVTSATQDAIAFDTGIGLEGANNHIEVRVFDHCKFASSTEPTEFGAWYPHSISHPLVGITTDVNGVHGPGPGNVIDWGFDETIETNPDVYTSIDEFNAELKFCVRISLFVESDVVNWDELDVNVPIEYSVPMFETEEPTPAPTPFPTPTLAPTDPSCQDIPEGEDPPPGLNCDPGTLPPTPSPPPTAPPEEEGGGGFGGGDGGGGGGGLFGGGGGDGEEGGGLVLDIQTAPAEASYLRNHTWDYALDPEDLNSYFCDEHTHQQLPPGSSNHQGKAISVCFDVKDGTPFEVDKVLDLFVYDAAGSLTEVSVFVNGDRGNTHYALQYCETNKINPEVRTCVAQFMLAAAFYDYGAVVLRGYGSMLLRLEHRRRQLLVKLNLPAAEWEFGTGASPNHDDRRELMDDATAGYQVKQHYFRFDDTRASSSSAATTSTLWGYSMSATTVWALLFAAILG